MTTITALFAVFFILLLIGVPVAWSLGLAGFTTLLMFESVPLTVIPQRFFTSLDSFSLIAIPLFMFTGVMMNEAGMTRRIVDFAHLVVGHFRGGLAQVNVASSVGFAGISGSATADVAASGSIMIPAMKRAGYPAGFAVSLTAAASTIGPILPPSILMIIYGSMAGVSIGDLFVAGIIPGLLLAAAFLTYCYFWARRHDMPREERRAPVLEMLKGLRDCASVLVLPVFIIGGIRLGIFSATEAAAMAATYSLVLGLVTRRVRIRDLRKIFVSSAVVSALSLMIIAAASAFGWLLAREQVPLMAVQGLQGLTENPTLALIAICLGLLLIGLFLEASAALIILIPVLVVVQQAFGFDPIHFAIVVILCLVIGGITPPVGNLLFVAAGIGGATMSEVIPRVFGLVLTMLVVVALLIAFPWMVTALIQ